MNDILKKLLDEAKDSEKEEVTIAYALYKKSIDNAEEESKD